jgi:hypothetical protein
METVNRVKTQHREREKVTSEHSRVTGVVPYHPQGLLNVALDSLHGSSPNLALGPK